MHRTNILPKFVLAGQYAEHFVDEVGELSTGVQGLVIGDVID